MIMDHCLRGLFVFPPLVAVCLVTATALGQQRPDRFQGMSVAEFVQQRLETYDKDGDGKVSRDEAAGPMRGAIGRTDTNGDGFVDVPGKWPVETVSIQELTPNTDAKYRTIATREGRAVEGFSMGGSGAAKWGFKYPNLFGTVSILAGVLRCRGRLLRMLAEELVEESHVMCT